MLIGAYLTCGILGISLLATPENDYWFQPTLVVIGKAISTIFWLCCGLHSSELFPTNTRNATLCFLDASSKIGASAAPFIVDLLYTASVTLPNVIIGILTLFAAIPFFFLPESINTDVPQTIEDMEKMDKTLFRRVFNKKEATLVLQQE